MTMPNSAEGQVINTVVTFYQRFFSTWLLLAKEGLGISVVSLAKKNHTEFDYFRTLMEVPN